ncbi:hypothetical protein OROMI_023758 [Orobanche minor]
MSGGGVLSLVVGFVSFLHFCMYAIILGISCWAMNTAIDHGSIIGPGMNKTVQLSPIYFPIGNAATGFFVYLALGAGIAGVASSFFGLISSCCGLSDAKAINGLASAAAGAWIVTLFAMGFACKEIELQHVREAQLRTMEVLIIILSATQPFYICLIHATALD